MSKEEVNKEVKELEEQIASLKNKKNEIESKYTFKGIYQKVAGRNNLLKSLQKADLPDGKKYDQAVEIIKDFGSKL